MAALDIFLFGTGRIAHDAAPAETCLPPSSRALLGYLVLNRHQPHHRDVLASEFWADVEDRCARNRLSTALWRLRRELEPDGVPTGSYLQAGRTGEVRFDPTSDHWLDVDAFERAADAVLAPPPDQLGEDAVTAFERTARLCRRGLLEGADHPWLVVERERLGRLYIAANVRVLLWHAARGAVGPAVVAGEAVLEREPLREDVHRALIRVYTASGQRSLATAQFERCRELLGRELGVLPLPETTAAAVDAWPSNGASAPAPIEAGGDPDDPALAALENVRALLASVSESLERATAQLAQLERARCASVEERLRGSPDPRPRGRDTQRLQPSP